VTATAERMKSQSITRIFPVIRYREARASIDWLVRAFGFEKQAEFEGPNGTIRHAEVAYGAGALSISSVAPPDPENPWSSVLQGIYVRVDDPDAHHARAQAAGAQIAVPLEDQHYGSRDYSARDPDGYLWGFGTYAMGDRRGDVAFVPEIRCRDAAATVKWLAHAFAFMPTLQVHAPNGSLVHAELKFDESAVYVGQLPASGETEVQQFVNVVVADADAHHARAKAAGAAIVIGPQDSPFGARFYGARDPEGFLWWVSTYRPAEGP
jgi:uncharacterized glyoxalase superfamily protein PhnB